MAGSFNSIKKSKKSNNAKLPKQPQRGLGVAQLEKIRMQRQIADYIIHPSISMQSPFLANSQQGINVEALPFSSSSVMPQASGFVHNPNILMAYKCSERPEARYKDCVHWHSTSSSSSHNDIISHRQDSVTLPLFEQNVQESENYMRRQQHEWIHVIDLTTPNDEEIDLELRL